ncbi:zinc ribbon domain-containing protein [Mycobacterium sp. CBMA293]|uniref:zinc ribbon domain-containing protein n=1 Tax=unclassified Mycolicibacterium TaxID=2636767 RepID=UPI0012DD03B2|nr:MULTISPECIES: zinc ribbon domain-containing protein [unclassified Mycolicibacterium]MUL44528.1 zinc ribbon domain-containing protein [Mycolicibacterium sp. CBMA 360]MUL59848.1 zinc ribbon domain-containing protein [Mycolicibacterium sp. CBMA 335]MUL68691.1 zinc ribbon domain-containing protein [Mycolicibacterium sp. CBMA 311]MUL93918.1 zinc ribbon domain-containing protein [Mycolicibacterium sp. CBMA 230]MUM12822.1 zinc ribbon domain-containing protein [Mycolicibacterium sp. CBMA 293]
MSALRLRSYAAAPREHVLRPWLVSSLFPLLSARTHRSFQIGLAVVVASLMTASAVRLAGLFISTVAVGIPLLFALYVRQLDYRGSAAARLFVSAGLGIGFGVAFALGTGMMVSRAYGVPLESGIAAVHLRTVEAGLSAVEALAVIAPIVMIRVFSPGSRKALYGYVIGASSALGVTGATTVVRMFAQLDSGLIDGDQPLSDFLIEAGIRGLTMPITAAAAAGMLGAALWFKSPKGPIRWRLLLIVIVPVLAHMWLSDEDSAGISQWAKVAWHVGFAVLGVLLLRLVLHLALLNEDAGDVPESTARTLTARRLVATWAAVIAVLAVGLVGVSAATTEPVARYECPPNCGHPLMGKPVAINPTFTAADGAFTVSYPAPGSAYKVSTDDTGVTAQFTGGGGGVMRLWGEPARGRDATAITKALLMDAYPDSRVAYELPNAMVGYHSGYGVAADDWPDGQNVVASRTRILIIVAVKDDLALVAAAAGPFHEFGAHSGPPTGVSLELAADMGKYVNSFRWRGDPPR